MHNAWVTTAGEKMSKSLGNSLLVREVVRRVRPIELRYYLASAHYRSAVEFSFEALEENAVAFRRIEAFLHRAVESVGLPAEGAPAWPAAFGAAMDDDLGVPQALAVLHDTVRAGNAALDRSDPAAVTTALGEVLAMTSVLGIDPFDEPWRLESAVGDDAVARAVVDALVRERLAERAEARARKDFASADAIRDALRTAGVVLEDTASGPRWTLEAPAAGHDESSDDESGTP